MAELEIRNLTIRFGGLAAVNGFDMEVHRKEIVGLIGPNGAGKTTLFNMISGVYRPTLGNIFFQGKDVTILKPHRTTRLGIARTFQQTTLFDQFSVLDNVLSGLYLEGKAGFVKSILVTKSVRLLEAELLEKASEIIRFCGLDDFVDESASNLPHGLKRILGIAIALACNPVILLLDEPFTGMNARETAQMIELILKLRDTKGLTCVIVEHNMKAVMELCDRVVVMNHGEKLTEGVPGKVAEDPAVIEAYLGGPANAV